MNRRQPHSVKNTVQRQMLALKGIQGQDLSGSDYNDLHAQGQNFFESIFNGCHFGGFSASQSIFQHVEFTEAEFEGCNFEDTSFDHSDFVFASISGTRFSRCSFQNAEWRDTSFRDVEFQQCIFRNTTISLTTFTRCFFDDPSSTSFMGPSKRYSLFSSTTLRLAPEFDFLRYNFGIVSPEPVSIPIACPEDPLYLLALYRYSQQLNAKTFCELVVDALADFCTTADAARHRLRFKYLFGICKLLVQENFLSVFALEFLHRQLTKNATSIRDRDQALDLFGLILELRVSINERIHSIEEELAVLPSVAVMNMGILMEFEQNYNRPTIEHYLARMADFCGFEPASVTVTRFEQGSTIVDFAISAATSLQQVVKYIRLSLPVVTTCLKQAGQLKKTYKSISVAGPLTPQKSSQVRRRPRKSREVISQAISSEISGEKTSEVRAVEIFVDKAEQRVLVVDGRVKITISMA